MSLDSMAIVDFMCGYVAGYAICLMIAEGRMRFHMEVLTGEHNLYLMRMQEEHRAAMAKLNSSTQELQIVRDAFVAKKKYDGDIAWRMSMTPALIVGDGESDYVGA